jgi:hypothetical protein
MQKGTDWETRTLLKTNGELIPASHVYIYTFNHRDTEEEILCQVKIA